MWQAGGMEHVRLGSTGLRVSRLCLGTMTFGLQCDEPTSRAILDRAAEGGITFIDTADVYPLGGGLEIVGRTEEIVGRWLAGRRDQYVVASKCAVPVGQRPWDQGTSRRHILDAVHASLRRLGTDFIDLYQLHQFDTQTPYDETLEALDVLLRAGDVRYIGCSNWQAFRIARALGRSEVLGVGRFASVQPRYNLLFREMERELLPMCQEEGLAVIPYNPIAGGMLSGKHDRNSAPTEGTRFAIANAGDLYQRRYWQERTFDTVDALKQVAADLDIPLPTLALAWVLHQPAVTAPIVGASRPDQLDATLAAVDVQLDAATLQRLDDLTRHFRYGDWDR
jgi:aryl-alcohol dehydrogenase-like predicted oxidoreductase